MTTHPSPASTGDRWQDFLTADGIWLQILRPHGASSGPGLRPALFLDRDGVIVEEVGHLARPEDIRLAPGAATMIARANGLGVPVVVVTNQSGVGRGFFGWDDFVAVQAEIVALLSLADAALDAVFACPHHPDALPRWRHPNHPARKPNSGMLLAAAERLAIDLPRSWIVGDRASDMAAGLGAGLAGGVLVSRSGDANPHERTAAVSLAAGASRFRVLVEPSVAAACAALPLLAEPPRDGDG